MFGIFESLGHDEVATILHGALDGAGVMHTLPLEPGTADDFDRAVERLCSRLGRDRFAEAAAKGRAMRDEEVVRFALAAITDAKTSPQDGKPA